MYKEGYSFSNGSYFCQEEETVAQSGVQWVTAGSFGDADLNVQNLKISLISTLQSLD